MNAARDRKLEISASKLSVLFGKLGSCHLQQGSFDEPVNSHIPALRESLQGSFDMLAVQIVRNKRLVKVDTFDSRNPISRLCN
nr:unnamed protein product [Fasciola hepatica]